MNSILRRGAQAIILPCAAALALTSLAGCQGHKVVARVNTASINDEEFKERALRFRDSKTLEAAPNLDVGGAVLILMIKEELLHQLAATKNATVSKESVQQFASLETKNPQIANAISKGALTQDDLVRQMTTSLEQFGIGTDGAKVDEAALKKKYEEKKNDLKFPEAWTIRMLQAPSEEMAAMALQAVKSGKSFSAAATEVLHVPAPQAALMGQKNVVQASQIQSQTAALYEALSKLAASQLTEKPVAVTINNPQLPAGQTIYVIAQMVEKNPEFIPTLEQIRPLVQQMVLSETRPEWRQHFEKEMADFTQKSDIQINIDRYKDLLNSSIRVPEPQTGVGAPGGMSAAPPPESSPSPAPGGTSPSPGSKSPSPGSTAPSPAPGKPK